MLTTWKRIVNKFYCDNPRRFLYPTGYQCYPYYETDQLEQLENQYAQYVDTNYKFYLSNTRMHALNVAYHKIQMKFTTAPVSNHSSCILKTCS